MFFGCVCVCVCGRERVCVSECARDRETESQREKNAETKTRERHIRSIREGIDVISTEYKRKQKEIIFDNIKNSLFAI